MKVIVGIATKGDRPEQLEITKQSLFDNVFSCGFDAHLVWVYDNSVSIDYSDNAKFKYLELEDEPVYYFSCDDDIIYPKDYIEKTIEQIEKHKCIISWHGRILREGQSDYYRGNHIGMRFFQQNSQDMVLDVAGTGVTGFRTDYFNPVDIYKSEYKRMSDLVFSLEAWKQGKRIISPAKKHLWIKPQETKSSILATEVKGNQVNQIALMNEILTCKKG